MTWEAIKQNSNWWYYQLVDDNNPDIKVMVWVENNCLVVDGPAGSSIPRSIIEEAFVLEEERVEKWRKRV